ncbi:MAG: type II secretion system major pseudopilin GspG [bacterium]
MNPAKQNSNCSFFFSRRAKQRGFTLIEVLVVIVIITILASFVTLNIVNKPSEARAAAAKLQVKELQSALQVYRTEQGRYPTQAQGLEALVAKPTSEPMPPNYPVDGYLSATSLPKDPWKNDYVYLVPGRKGEPYEVISYGSDGEPGGEGDASDLSSSDP